ncbi:hypothetical protein [Brevundimonas sp.]|uniref:hypothetical protein n=1 Tax=Brevundimonas sp. TaxID=1871086 RepID=UPI0028A28FC2|nr:hypothetical protein [Brevundimonas sp.]
MIQSDPMAQISFSSRRRAGGGFVATFMWLGGLIATAVAVTVGAVLAVLTAAAVAMLAVIGGVVLFFAGFALRARRNRQMRQAQKAADEGVIDAQKVGDTWVAYGWEREGR